MTVKNTSFLSSRPPIKRQVLLAVATMLVSLSVMSIVATLAVYDGRVERSSQRAPRDAEFYSDEEVTFRFAHSFEEIDLLPLSVVYLQPIDATATPPPGLGRWPAPGEVAASPALLGSRVLIEATHGAITQTIAREGLASPGEKLLYVAPPEGARTAVGWREATGFGSDNRASFAGEIWDVQPAERLAVLFAAFLVTPAFVLLDIVARMDLPRRQHRSHVLEVIGVPPRLLLRVEWLSIWSPLLFGVALAIAVALLASTRDVPVPLAAYTLDHRDVRAAFPVLALTAGGSGAVCAAVVLARTFPSRMPSAARPRSREPRYHGVRAAAAVVVLGVCGRMAVQEAIAGRQESIIWVTAGTIGGALLMPSLCGWLVKVASQVVHAIGRRRGKPDLLVAGAQIGGSVGTAARLASLTALLIFLTTQTAMFTLLGQYDAARAEQVFAAIDGRFAVMDVPDYPGVSADLRDVLAQLPSDVNATLLVNRVQERGPGDFVFGTVLSGTPGDLAAFQVAPGSAIALAALPSPLDTVVAAGGVGEPTIEIEATGALEPHEQDAELVDQSVILGTTYAGSLDRVELQARVNEMLSPGWHVGTPGDGWRVGARTAALQARWIAWAGIVGAAMLLAASWIRSGEDTRRAVTQAAPIGALTGATSFFYRVAGVRVAIVLVIGTAVGGVAATQYSTVVTAQGAGIDAPYALVAALCGMAALAGAMVLWLGGRAGATAAATWRPGGERL